MKLNSLTYLPLAPGQNGCQFGRHFQKHFLNENEKTLIQISLKFVPRSPIDN